MKKLILLFLFSNICNQLMAQDPMYSINRNTTWRSHITLGQNTHANICGWEKDGREYAIVGGNLETVFIDVTNPDTPIIITKVPSVANNLWKEIKTYKNYAYVTTEGGGGLQIIDMADLPSAFLVSKLYTGDDTIIGRISKIHALHIDTVKGYCYLYGASGIANGGAVVLDLKTDPWNPKYVGQYNKDYIHDGFALNDTLYGSHIYGGYFSIIDFKNKSNPIILNTQITPTAFTHNTWLSDDHKSIFTTDENSGSFLGSYDISDVKNIKFLDKIQSNPGSGAIIHNTHIRNDFAISSYYHDGIQIVDVHRPQNLIEVGNYDTYATGGNGFEGAWGAYPFFKSGTIVISNIESGLWVVSPTYKRACYLEGLVKDSITKAALNQVKVKIISTDIDKGSTTDATGNYRSGQVTPGSFKVEYSKVGYITKTITVNLQAGVVINNIVELVPLTVLTVSGKVIDNKTGLIVPNANVVLIGPSGKFTTTSDATGNYNVSVYKDLYSGVAGKWGYLHKLAPVNVNANLSNVIYRLDKGYQDDFIFNENWTKSNTASTGFWVKGIPVGTLYNGNKSNTDADVPTDIGEECYITGNGGGDAGTDDVDNGNCELISPVMDLTTYANPVLNVRLWFVDVAGNTPVNDTFRIYLNNGTKDTLIYFIKDSQNAWRSKTNLKLKNYLPITSNMTVRFWVGDSDPGHIVEGGVDEFLISEGNVAVEEVLDNNITINIAPNPFTIDARINYSLNEEKDGKLLIYNIQGQLIDVEKLNDKNGSITIGSKLESGSYFLQINSNGKKSNTYKIVKQ